jgi:hypothetical protein
MGESFELGQTPDAAELGPEQVEALAAEFEGYNDAIGAEGEAVLLKTEGTEADEAARAVIAAIGFDNARFADEINSSKQAA